MSQQAAWWSTFFSGLALETVKTMFPESKTRADADYLVNALRLEPGAHVADVPCGAGRIAIELAARGYRVSGLDLAPGLIAEASRSAAARGVEAAFQVGDMRSLPWNGTLDGLFCFGNSFGYQDDAGNRGFLAAAYGALRPGGRFALETGLAAESLLANFPVSRRNWYNLNDILMLREASYDPLRGEAHTDYTFLRNGTVEHKRATYSVYLYRELVAMLSAVGFEEIAGVGSETGDPFALGSQVLYLTATRPS